MAIGSTNVGGAGLIFRVQGFASLPEKAPEGTIGVITEAAITDYILSPNQPDHLEGRVWISTANESNLSIQPVRREPIYIFLSLCRQSVGGVWAPKTFKVRENGAWIVPWTALFDAGNEITGLTGGWVGPNKSNQDGKLGFYGSGPIYAKGCCETVNQIDLTAAHRLWLNFASVKNVNTYISLYASKNPEAENPEKTVQLSQNPTGWQSLDVSDLTGSYIVGIGFYAFDDLGGSCAVQFGNADNRPAIYLE